MTKWRFPQKSKTSKSVIRPWLSIFQSIENPSWLGDPHIETPILAMTWGNRTSSGSPFQKDGHLPEGEAVGVHVGEVHSVELHLVGDGGFFRCRHGDTPENTTTYPLVMSNIAIENGDL